MRGVYPGKLRPVKNQSTLVLREQSSRKLVSSLIWYISKVDCPSPRYPGDSNRPYHSSAAQTQDCNSRFKAIIRSLSLSWGVSVHHKLVAWTPRTHCGQVARRSSHDYEPLLRMYNELIGLWNLPAKKDLAKTHFQCSFRVVGISKQHVATENEGPPMFHGIFLNGDQRECLMFP